MSIMTRLVRFLKSDIHGVMDQLEDKRLLLNQYLREMETSLGQRQAQLVALSRRMDRLSGHLAHHTAQMKKVNQDVDLALSKEKDDIARMLLRRYLDLEASAGHVEEQISGVTQEKARLAETIRNQKLQYETLKARASTWHQRSEDDPFVSAAQSFAGDGSSTDVRDEEIEMALIRRKAALARGGAA